MERNQRKTLVGRVVSDKMDKTITVVVETKRNHPVYGKRINYSKKYKAHDENNVAKEGDIVVHNKLSGKRKNKAANLHYSVAL